MQRKIKEPIGLLLVLSNVILVTNKIFFKEVAQINFLSNLNHLQKGLICQASAIIVDGCKF